VLIFFEAFEERERGGRREEEGRKKGGRREEEGRKKGGRREELTMGRNTKE
jgi:hypothetical protein